MLFLRAVFVILGLAQINQPQQNDTAQRAAENVHHGEVENRGNAMADTHEESSSGLGRLTSRWMQAVRPNPCPRSRGTAAGWGRALWRCCWEAKRNRHGRATTRRGAAVTPDQKRRGP